MMRVFNVPRNSIRQKATALVLGRRQLTLLHPPKFANEKFVSEHPSKIISDGFIHQSHYSSSIMPKVLPRGLRSRGP